MCSGMWCVEEYLLEVLSAECFCQHHIDTSPTKVRLKIRLRLRLDTGWGREKFRFRIRGLGFRFNPR